MSADNETLFRRWFAEVWNAKNADAIEELAAPELVAHGMGPNGTVLHGPAAFKAVHAAFCGAFPDMHITVGPVVVNDDMVAGHFICEATHAGDHLGIAATGKAIRVTGMTITKYRDGKIVEGWNCLDLLPVFQKAGVLPLATGLP